MSNILTRKKLRKALVSRIKRLRVDRQDGCGNKRTRELTGRHINQALEALQRLEDERVVL